MNTPILAHSAHRRIMGAVGPPKSPKFPFSFATHSLVTSVIFPPRS